MDLDQLIEELTALRETCGGHRRVLWWDWEPGQDFDDADTQNVENVAFIGDDIVLS